MKARNRATSKWVKWLAAMALVAFTGTFSFAQKTGTPQTGQEVQLLFESGKAAFEQRRWDDALRAFNKVYVLSGAVPKTAALAQVSIGNVYMAQRKFEAATVAFQRSITLDPTYALAQNNLGEALGELRQFNRALEAFNKAIALDPQLSRARYNVGITYGRLDNLKYAEFVFRLLVRDRPDYDLGFDGLGVTLAKSGRAGEAIPFHQKAISLNSQEPSYYYNLGLSYLISGDTPKAVEQQQKLQRMAPEIANRLASAIVKRQMR
jgi:tetratricopeptide (TPR) repeat protein